MKCATLAVAVGLLALPPAFAGEDKTRSIYAKRWYTVAEVKGYLTRYKPDHYDRGFHKSVTWVFAEDGLFVPGKTPYIKLPMQKPVVESDNHWWRAEDKGKDLGAEMDRRCVMSINTALGRLKDQARQILRRTDVRQAVIDGVRSGVLSTAPLDLTIRKQQKVNMVTPEGDFRLLCTVYKSPRRNEESFFQYSVVLNATSVYGKLP